MTVVYKGEIAGERQGTDSVGNSTYTRAFRLLTTSTADDEYDVKAHLSLPSIGSVHPSHSDAYCVSKSAVNDEPWTGWKVVCNYSTERTVHATDPEQDETLVSFTSEIFQEVVQKDYNNKAVLNSAGDLFQEPPLRDAARLIAHVKTNLLAVPTWILSYQNAINDADCTVGGLTVAKWCAKMQNIAVSERKKRGATSYYELSYDIYINKDTWIFQPIDNGFRIKVPSEDPDQDGKLKTAVTTLDSLEPSIPVLLNGQGEVIEIVEPDGSNVEYLEFHIYPELDFTALPGVT